MFDSMDLRKMKNLEPVVNDQLKAPLQNLKYIHECLGRKLADEQGYLSSAVQMYFSSDITIKENIIVCEFIFVYACRVCTKYAPRTAHSPTLILLHKTMVSVLLAQTKLISTKTL